MQLATIYCIDGSGNRDQKAADRKRPIFRLDVRSGTISRPLLTDSESAFSFFSRQVCDTAAAGPVLITADLPIGLPTQPSDVYQVVGAETFLKWLGTTQERLAQDRQTWRDGLIAAGVAQRSAVRPFISIARGDNIAHVRTKRDCDKESGAESVYCVDHGGKQVGRAALQFWFEVLLPLRRQFGNRLAVWPFEPLDSADIIVGECYPTHCQRVVYGTAVKKRQPLEVARALTDLLRDSAQSGDIPAETWIHAASSEDEFDMFTTAFCLRKLLTLGEDIFWHPCDAPACTSMEGWILGLPRSGSLVAGAKRRPATAGSNARASGSPVAPVGNRNRHDQEDLGPSMNRGTKGPLHRLICRRMGANGIECGHEYETNAQDVFQKKCPVCQGRPYRLHCP